MFLGNCNIRDYSFNGTSTTILPKVNIGENVIIGAGTVVTKDIPKQLYDDRYTSESD